MGDTAWQAGKAYREIIYETCDGIAKITINRPERRNAFTPLTVNELYDAFTVARDDAAIGVIILLFGIVQLGLSIKSHDAAQRATGLLTLFGGLLIAAAPQILEMII